MKPLKSKRELRNWEVNNNCPREEQYKPSGQFVETVREVTAKTMSDRVVVRCLQCRHSTKVDRLQLARAFMLQHFLFFAARNEKGHQKFSLKCVVNHWRRFIYHDVK